MSKWFTSNKLALHLDLKIGYDEKYTDESINTKFLGLQTVNHLKWRPILI